MSQGIITTSPAVSLPAGRDIINANFTELYTAVTSTRAANLVWCGPVTGSSAAPTFRALVAADMPAVYLTASSDLDAAKLAGVPPQLNLGNCIGFPAAQLAGPTTVGLNLLLLASPSAIRFLQINADNSVTALSDTDFRTAIGAGTSNFDPASPGNIGTGTPGAIVATTLASTQGAAIGGATPDAAFGLMVRSAGNDNQGIRVMPLNESQSMQLGYNTLQQLGSNMIIHAVNGSIELATSGAFRWSLTATGNLVFLTSGGAIQLKSPDGTAYNATIANGGTWAITPA